MLEPIKFKITCDGCGKTTEANDLEGWLIVEQDNKQYSAPLEREEHNKYVGHYCNEDCLKKRISEDISKEAKEEIEKVQEKWINRCGR